MKIKFFIAVLTLSIGIVIYNPLEAQILGSANYLGVNSPVSRPNTSEPDFSNTTSSDDLSEFSKISNIKAMYMISEQFVFDNLSSLKKAFSIADIYFDLDDATIRPDAVPVLNYLVLLLKENPGINLATTAYADSRIAKYNKKLSLSRAQAAINYLISKGISADRLKIEKFGRPDIDNSCNGDPKCSIATQQLNRRTEFNIIYNGINLAHVN
jgi:outer membrane protein OmpA-like peptidoglycan-associated protein